MTKLFTITSDLKKNLGLTAAEFERLVQGAKKTEGKENPLQALSHEIYNKLYINNYQWLERWLKKNFPTAPLQDIEEVVQDVFIKFLYQLEYESDLAYGNLTAYFMQLAKWKMQDKIKLTKIFQQISVLNNAHEAKDLRANIEAQDTLQFIFKNIQFKNERYLDIVTDYCLNGLSYEEIGQKYNLSYENVKKYKSEAIKKLRDFAIKNQFILFIAVALSMEI
ncbi:MAG: Sigma-70, region 4 [Bacteroidota bacterium]|jgi:RNA polymerase sigma factor (sigma-70 family)